MKPVLLKWNLTALQMKIIKRKQIPVNCALEEVKIDSKISRQWVVVE